MVTLNSKEYTFPDLPSTADCKDNLSFLNKKVKPHKIIFWSCFALVLIFFILSVSFFCKESLSMTESGYIDENFHYEYAYEPDYTVPIIFSALFLISFITGIVNIALSSKYNKYINYFKNCIIINEQYSGFIKQGYDKKDAYRLTIEWMDRRAGIKANNDIALMGGVIAIAEFNDLIKK